MTKGPAIFLLGFSCCLFCVLCGWGMRQMSGWGVLAIIGGIMGAATCTFIAGEIDTRKD